MSWHKTLTAHSFFVIQTPGDCDKIWDYLIKVFFTGDTGAFICFLLKYLWIGKTRIILLISLSHYLLFICCIYLSRINYRMSGTRHKVYSKLMIKASEWIALVFLILKKLLLLLIFEQLHKMLWKHIYER